MSATLTTLKQALALDTSAFAPLRGLRAALGIALVLGIGVAIGETTLGIFAAIGALTSGTVAMSQGSRPPVGTMAVAGAALAVSAVVGGLTARHLVLGLGLLAVWAALSGLASGISQSATTVGVQAVVGLVVIGRFPLDLRAAFAAGGEVLIGAGVQLLLTLVIRPPVRDRVERRGLAAVADALGAWATTGGRRASSQLADQLDALRTLFDRRRGWSENAPLRAVLTGLSRARLEVSVLTLERDRRPAERKGAIDSALRAASTDFASLANELRDGRTTRRTGDASLARLLTDRDDVAMRRAHALAGQLRAAQLSLQAWAEQPRAGLPRPRRGPAGTGRIRDALLRPTPAARRHAVRLAILLPLCELLARELPFQRGYWVALTAVVVLKPDFATSVKRGIARVLGTLIGVVPVSVLVGLTHPRGFTVIVFVGLLAWCAFATLAVGYVLYSAFLAGLVVVLLDLVSPGGASIAGARAIDTLVGGTLALLTYLALPSWEGPQLAGSVAALITAEDGYAGKVLVATVNGHGSSSELGSAASSVRRARAALEAALGRAEVEPALLTGSAGPRRIETARNVLSATTRIVASLHVLHAQAVDEDSPAPPCPDITPFVAALHAALAELAQAVDGSSLVESADLRKRAAPIVDAGPSASLARRTLAREVDELVDAVDSLRYSLTEVPPLPVTS